MRKQETEKIRKQLEEQREEILQEVKRIRQRETEYLNDDVGDDIDMATGSAQREILFYLNDRDRQKLDAIEDAIDKIDEGRFGKCEQCGSRIKNDRLRVKPYARFCMKCKPTKEDNS